MGGVPDIFEGGVYGVVRRAVIIGNGFPASENQSMGLVRALGLSDKQTLYVSLKLISMFFFLFLFCFSMKYVCQLVSTEKLGGLIL